MGSPLQFHMAAGILSRPTMVGMARRVEHRFPPRIHPRSLLISHNNNKNNKPVVTDNLAQSVDLELYNLAQSVDPELYKFHDPDDECIYDVWLRMKADLYNSRLRRSQIGNMKARKAWYEAGLLWKRWEDTHSLPLRLAVCTSYYSFKNFFIGLFLSYMLMLNTSDEKKLLSVFHRDYHPMVYSFTRSKFMFALNFAVFWGSYAFIAYLMKTLRGKEEDLMSSMVGGLGSGVMFSLVAGLRGLCIIPVGVITALLCGLRFKTRKKKRKKK